MEMTANNMKQLNAMLMKELRKAMNVTSKKVLADMYEETGNFYTQGKEPTIYERTGALGDTPRTTSVSTSGNEASFEASFEAYLDKDHQYTTGANPTMEDVLNLTKAKPEHNSSVGYLRSVRGRTGFWERANEKMGERLDETLNKFFDEAK